jgi:SOS response regulatory protein OraA/RecX
MLKKRWAKREPSSKSSDADRAYITALRTLTRQDRSAFELKKKLSQWYTTDAVIAAIERVIDRGYLKPESDLAKRAVETQRMKGRGKFRIQQELKKRGLPVQSLDPEDELTQCQNTYIKKFGRQKMTEQSDRAKAARFLAVRGFDLDTIRKVINVKWED